MQNRTIAWDYDEEISDETPSTTIGMDQATYTAQYMKNHHEDNIEEPAEDTKFAHELYGQLQNPMPSNIWGFSVMMNNQSSAMDDSLAYMEQFYQAIMLAEENHNLMEDEIDEEVQRELPADNNDEE